MPRDVSQILDEIERVGFERDDYLALLHDLCTELEACDDRAQATGPILRFMERNAEQDLGAPGPLVHLLEKLPGYENDLVESLRRTPTALTVWMLNRLINVSGGDPRSLYLALMRGISTNAAADPGAREAAISLLRYQEQG
jgi:hypothetical protein